MLMTDINAISLTGLAAAVMFLGGWLLTWARKSEVNIDFAGYDLITHYGNQRLIERVNIAIDPVPLRPGNNHFYLVVSGGEGTVVPPSRAYLLNPILRNSEDVLFFRVQVRVVGKNVVKFDATNLSKVSARLVWSKA